MRLSVSEGDEIFDHIINWLATQPGFRNALSLRIGTCYSDLAKKHELIELEPTAIGPDGSGIQFNFSNEISEVKYCEQSLDLVVHLVEELFSNPKNAKCSQDDGGIHAEAITAHVVEDHENV